MASESKLDVRVSAAVKDRIALAASLEGSKVSQFVRTSALLRADQVIAEHMTYTSVPAEFFDDIIDAIDQPNTPLRRAARRADAHVVRS